MNTIIDCYKHDNPLIQKRLKEVSVEEGLAIATKLFEILNKRKDGIGLAANQVGIDARVAVLNVREPLILINPEIISKEVEIPYYEGCLSFPKKGCHTKRYETIEVKTAQEEGSWIFSGCDKGADGMGFYVQRSFENAKRIKDKEIRTLEAVCVQHEIDHLMGKTIHEREKKLEPVVSDKKIGRNDPCGCNSSKKYKKCCGRN